MTYAPENNDEARLRRKRPQGRRLPGPGEQALSLLQQSRYHVEYAGFRLAEALIRGLGLERSAALSAFLWRRIAPLTSRHGRALEQLAEAMPQTGADERRRILDGMWDNLGRTFAEGFFLDDILADETRLEVDAEAETLSRRGAVIYATLHTGNWEVAAAASTRIGCQLAGIYQKLKNPFVEQRILAMRGPLYRGGLHEKGSNLVHLLTAWARAGNPVGIVSDLRDPRGIEVPFFGRATASTPFPAYLAHKLDIPLLAIRVVRLPGSRFRVEMRQVEVPRTENRLDDIRSATAAIQATFEDWIRERPEQWMWMHRRWG